ncbi:MAG: TolC family protein [Candidatus Eremiobacteraeota bacterium]|nr:TolC family protein [Candidatus Eremiobacteraeota bacterium]
MKGWLLVMLLALSLAAAAEPTPLGLDEAIGRAVESNLRTQESRERIREAEGSVQAAYAAYAPQLGLTVGQFNRTVNLKAQGFDAPGLPIPALIGPFYSFDSRLQLLYKVFDPKRGFEVEAASLGRDLRQAESELARRTVTVLTAVDYIYALQAEEKLQTSQADLALAERLLKLAQSQEEAGVGAGVDVTRAQTRLAEQRLTLTQDEESVRSTRRELLRVTGLPLTSELALTDHLQLLPNPYPSEEDTVEMARTQRLEMRLKDYQVALAEARLHSTEAENSPTVDVAADVGFSGNTPFDNSFITHSVGVNLRWPLFDGGATEGQIESAKSRLTQARLERDDQSTQVDKDVRDAYSILRTAKARLEVSGQAVELARTELEMSEDRFSAGLTNNIEVLSSQAALTRLSVQRVDALAAYNLALIQLAAASGRPDMLMEVFHKRGVTDE